MMKPRIHVDEFSSKMGDDDDIIVISFYVRADQAARDLMNWFEKGYDFVLDSDKSPGELKPNRYLVYIELRRRSSAAAHIEEILKDLETLTEFDLEDWTMHYDGKTVPFSRETFESMVPMNPATYRQRMEKDLNDIREAAGIDTKPIYERDKLMQSLQHAAGL